MFINARNEDLFPMHFPHPINIDQMLVKGFSFPPFAQRTFYVFVPSVRQTGKRNTNYIHFTLTCLNCPFTSSFVQK